MDPIWKRFFEGQAKECSSVLPSHAFQDHSYHPRKSKNINRSFLYLLLKKEIQDLAIFIYSIILDLNYLLAPCTSSMKINEVGRAWFFITMRNHYTIVIKNVISSLLLKKLLTLSNGIDTGLRVGLMFYSQKRLINNQSQIDLLEII